MSSDVEKIKDRLNIVDVVGDYVRLQKAGKNYKGLSPFTTEKTPSFFVSPERNLYHCFSTNKGGDIFTFVQEMEGLDFQGALQNLADRAGVTLTGIKGGDRDEKERLKKIIAFAQTFYSKHLDKKTEVIEYLESRGIKKETIKEFGIGFAPDEWDLLYKALQKKGASDEDLIKSGMCIRGQRGVYDRFRNRIMFPIFDYSDVKVGFSGRLMPGESKTVKDGGKYINNPETPLYNKSKALYGIEKAKQHIREKDECILVEGQMDVVMSHQAGAKNTIAVSGTALTEEHIKTIKRLTDSLTVVLDSDSAGFSATSRAVLMALRQGMYVDVVPLPEGTDPADMVKENEKNWKEILSNKISFSTFAIDFLMNKSESLKDRQKMIKEHLYPYIKEMQNVVHQDRVLQEIADALSVSVEAVRSDLAQWEGGYVIEKTTDSSPTPKDTEEQNRKQKIKKQLTSIILWKEKDEDFKNLISETKKKLESLEKGFFETDLKNKDFLVFEAESYYNESPNLEKEILYLLTSFEREVLQEKLQAALQNLRQAENQNNEREAQKMLRLCHDLTNRINLLDK